jgi:hypothetical protein
MLVSPLTMSHPSPRVFAPPSLPLFIRGPLKEGWGLFAFGALAFALGFWCGKLLEGKRFTEGKTITEGKRIAKGKLLKGIVWLKRG